MDFFRPSFLRRSGANDENLSLPERFDARKEWPTCNSIGLIRNQVPMWACTKSMAGEENFGIYGIFWCFVLWLKKSAFAKKKRMSN